MNSTGSSGDRFLVFSASVLYVGSVVLTPFIYATYFRIPQVVRYEELPRVVFDHQVAALVLVLPPVLLLLIAGLTNPGGALRQALRGFSLRRALWMLVAVFTLSLLLDWVGVWPFTWRSRQSNAPVHVANLLGTANGLGLSLLAVRLIVITPLIEEVVFRFVLLREASRLPGGTHAGVLVSATAFALLHLGAGGDSTLAMNAAWLFVFSIALGYGTAGQGTLNAALAAHASRNFAELAALCLAVEQSI